MSTCTRKGCCNTATFTPIMRFWAKGFPKIAGQQATAEIGLPVCDACAATITLDDLLTDEGKKLIAQMLFVRGKAAPDFATAELEWQPLKARRLQ